MKIVILGAGTVGISVAQLLSQYRHSVTVVDKDPSVIGRIKDTLDARVMIGSAAESSVLFQAGVMNADFCLAMTNSDEVNIVAASMAKEMGTRRVAARVYASVFRDVSTFDYQSHFKIDRLLSLEQLTALRLSREMDQFSGVLNMDNYFWNSLDFLELEIKEKSRSAGKKIRNMNFPSGVRISSIRRDGINFIAGPDDELIPGDHIALIGREEDVAVVRKALDAQHPERKNVIIAGAGETGLHLAEMMQTRHNVRIMEADLERCRYLSGRLNSGVQVINVDVQSRVALEEEHAGNADVFIACTGYDENNLLACVEVKELGAKRVFSVIERPDYGNVIGKLGIDCAVSPREEVAHVILNMMNCGCIITNDGILGAGVRILEIEVQAEAPITTCTLAEARLPAQCLILAAIQKGNVIVPGAQCQLKAGDIVIAMVHDRNLDLVREKFERAH